MVQVGHSTTCFAEKHFQQLAHELGAGIRCFLANNEVVVAFQVEKQGIKQQRRLAQLPTLVLTEARRARRVNNNLPSL